MWQKLWIFYRQQKKRIDGLVIGAAGITILVWAGVLSSSKTGPPSTPELVVLLAAAAVLQVWAGVTFGKIGHVDGDKAKSAVRLLLTMGSTISILRSQLQSALAYDEPDRYKTGVVRADEALGSLGRHLVDAIADWTDVHPEALADTLASQQSQSDRVFGKGADQS